MLLRPVEAQFKSATWAASCKAGAAKADVVNNFSTNDVYKARLGKSPSDMSGARK